MKTLFLSDVHANIYALEAIWQQENDSDLILCAGDLVDYGPYPRAVIAWMQERGARCVQGNHDAHVARLYRDGIDLERIPERERTWAHINTLALEESDVRYLEGLPPVLAFDLDGIACGMTHLYRAYEEIVSLHAYDTFVAEAFGVPFLPRITRLLMGHTHRQAVRWLSNDTGWVNPGSASYRRRDDPDQTAHYATITDGTISLHRLAYDYTPLRQFFHGIRLKESEMDWARFFWGER